MALWKSFSGIVHFEVTSASVAETLSALNASGVKLLNITLVDPLTICGSVYRCDFRTMRDLLNRRGEKLKILRREGLYWTLKGLCKRKLLLTGMTILAAAMVFLPTRVLFVRVEGNTDVPVKLIVEKANSCGLVFGASRREVRSERMKNALLAAIPQLQWAGINTYGCVAVISVEERSVPDTQQEQYGVSSIVAARDGIIDQCTVLQGNPLCKTGQAVKAGQVLVSGYTDCGISIKATQAKAEITAQTIRELTVLAPTGMLQRGQIAAEETRYSLIVGKKLINLFKDSGIYDTSCVKMYEKYYLTLPGGFQLPVALVRERIICYSTQSGEVDPIAVREGLKSSAERYLKEQMVAGQILNAAVTMQQEDGLCVLYGSYDCLEMIGKVRKEEIIDAYDKSN